MNSKVALVTGVSGSVGHRVADYLAAQSGWRVIGVSRRTPEQPLPQSVQHMSLDLMDASACRAVLGRLSGITHFINAARFDHDTSTLESPDTNTEMLRHALDALAESKQLLKHVHIVQGTKYYGSHLGSFRTPAKETDPRSLQGNFYYKQQDLVTLRQRLEGWTWSASRPHAIVDISTAAARSIPMVIAVYAAISKELDLPLCFPGTEENYRSLYQFTEAGLLARAIEWMSTSEAAANQAFNITNGDYIRWCNVWPAFAAYFGMDLGPVRTIRLAQAMADKGDVWRKIVEKHKLVTPPYEKIALWAYGDFVFTPYWDIMSCTLKARQHGFQEFVDSEAMFFQVFDTLRQRRIIPPA